MNDLYADAVIACTDLVGRAGARSIEFGHTGDDDTPDDDITWYAIAEYQGTKVIAQNHSSPTAAAMALATRLLTSARCKCRKLVALSDEGAIVVPGRHLDGTRTEATATAGQCRWRLMGQRWEPSCDAPPLKVDGERGQLPMRIRGPRPGAKPNRGRRW